MSEYDIVPFAREREIVVDAGYLASRRHIIYGLAEVDVTRAREILRSMTPADGSPLSFTAFIVSSLSSAIEAHPYVQAYRDWRGRLIVFGDVDVVTLVEHQPGTVAVPHIVRQANKKTVQEISDEIKLIKAHPENSKQYGGLLSLAPKLPRFTRLLFFWVIKKNPQWFKRFEGTVVVTSIGMFAKGGLWGLGFLPTHTMGLTVGGIARKPGVHEGSISIRDYVYLTIAFDHDIVDGAPASRFSHTLVDIIEKAAVLDNVGA